MKTGPKLQPRMIKTPQRAISHTAATNRKTRDGLIGTPPTIFTRRRALRSKNAFLTIDESEEECARPAPSNGHDPDAGPERKDEKAAERKSEMAEKKYPIALDWFRICVGKNPIRSVLWSIRGKKLSCLAVVVAKHTADSVLLLRNPLCVAYSYLTRATCNVRCQQITTV
jgi:hypothetical protein